MERLSKKIIQYVIENNIFLEDDKEIYAFGLTQMIRAVVDDNREPDNES